MRIWIRFFVLATIAITAQFLLWQVNTLTDSRIWERRVGTLIPYLTSDIPVAPNQYSGHPGTSFLFPAALLHYAGFSTHQALLLALSVINGFIIAILGVIAWQLHPNQAWWIGAFVISLVHPLYLQASPTNAVMMCLVSTIVLLIWLLWERPNRNWTIILGLLLGIGLSTRWASTSVLLTATVVFLAFRLTFSRLLLVNAIALVTFVMLDPVIWVDPVGHLEFLWQRIDVHYNQVHQYGISLKQFGLFAPFALLSIVLTLTALYVQPASKKLISKHLVIFLLLLTTIDCLIFFSAANPSLRYFFPDIIAWEMLLPLSLVALLQRITPPPSISQHWRAIISWLPVIAVAGSSIFLLIYSLYLPAVKVFIDWHTVFLR